MGDDVTPNPAWGADAVGLGPGRTIKDMLDEGLPQIRVPDLDREVVAITRCVDSLNAIADEAETLERVLDYLIARFWRKETSFRLAEFTTEGHSPLDRIELARQ